MNIVTDCNCKVVTQPEARKQIVCKSGHCFVVVISVGSVNPIQCATSAAGDITRIIIIICSGENPELGVEILPAKF